MSNQKVTPEIIPKKYALLSDFINICPKCQERLTYEDGLWYCENCPFEEFNNVIQCRECLNLFFGNWKERCGNYCDVRHPEGGSCRQFAIAESDYNYQQDLAMHEHIKGCQDDNCDCRNY